jgi:hypothetical protein
MSGTQLISILLVVGGGLIWWLKSGAQHSALRAQKSGSGI